MGPVGVQEMIVIFLVALVLFGPKKLPELGKSVAKAISEFRRAQNELKSTFESHMRELEKENESIKEVTRSYTNEIYNTYAGYDSSYPGSAAAIAEPSHPSEADPSTVSAPAPQGAESTASSETPANGTVPRSAFSEKPSEAAASHPVEPESHSVGG